MQLGDITAPGRLLAILSFFVIAALLYRDFKSGVLISILLVTGIALAFGLVEYQGVGNVYAAVNFINLYAT